MSGRRVFAATMGLAFLCTVSACGNKSTDAKRDAFAAEATDNTLTTGQFGLTVKKPDDWYAASFEELNNIMDAAVDIATDGRPGLELRLERADKNMYNLFSISKADPAQNPSDNPNVFSLAERVSDNPQIKTGKDYWELSIKLLAQANVQYDIEDGYKTRMIDGVAFDQIDLTLGLAGNAPVNQTGYAAPKGEFMILIIQSWNNEKGKAETSDIIDTIKLDW